ncbi:MAG: DUF5024 domain-containing protein [Dysgonamonadaceae bacterium]|jgi:lipopolysaccharide export LptBFGC system permease protein LptF|nr:DUF5024 domain-containing protein [Dysgonamonadaceae bacterium]
MKTEKSSFIAAVLFAISFNTAVYAQSRIDALISKCENLESVDMEVIKQKSKESKTERKIINLKIKDNQKLVGDFLAAFKKDESNADRTVSQKRGVKEMMNFQFGETMYSITTRDGKDAIITVDNSPILRKARAISEKALEKVRNLNLDSIIDANTKQIKIDSMVSHSYQKLRRIDWDSVASRFATRMDSAAVKFGADWEDFYWDSRFRWR